MGSVIETLAVAQARCCGVWTRAVVGVGGRLFLSLLKVEPAGLTEWMKVVRETK